MTARNSRALVLAVLLATPARALAQQPPEPPPAPQPPAAQGPESAAARADALFQEGKKLLEQGKAAEACPLLEKADALDPTVSTIGLLAACHEQQGLVATALREFRETIKRTQAANDSRADFARQRVTALEATVPRLSIRLTGPVAGLEVLRDGKVLPPDGLAETPVDPGAHEILVRAPGYQSWLTNLGVQQGYRLVVAVPALVKLAPPPAPPAPPPSPRSGMRTAAFVTGGLGLIGLGIGTALGVNAIRQNSDSTTIHGTCRSAAACAPGRDARDAAFASATGSTIAFVAGGAGVLTGVVLLALPPAQRPSPRGLGFAPFAGKDGGGALLRGRF